MTQKYNVVQDKKRRSRLSSSLSAAILQPKSTFRHLKAMLFSIYSDQLYKKSPIPVAPLSTILPPNNKVTLESFYAQDGNVSYLEILCLTSCIKTYKPKNILEIGTFDGNSTLQIALNAPKNAKVHTLDLPTESALTALPIEKQDLKYTKFKQKRKYEGTCVDKMITQHFGDSTQIDFLDLSSGKKFDFIFVDGGHSFECIENDTKKSFESLSPGGVIVWHDYSPHWQGVCRHLDSLSTKRSLKRIENTSLVIYENRLD